MAESGPAAAPSRAGIFVLLVPAALVLALGAGVRGRVPVQWPALVLAAALDALGAWCLYQLACWGRLRWREVLLAGLSLAAALGMAEVALRRLRPYDSLCRFRWIASTRLHHVNPPARRMFSGYVEGRPVVVETNQDGLRTRHSRDEFRGHAVRVAVLGDSFVFGSGVDADEAFPARLERRLRERTGAGEAAVLNAGVISYSPYLEQRLFEDVVSQYRPTLVLLFLDVTDIGDDWIYARKSRGGAFALEGETRVECYGAVYQLVQPYLAWLGAHLLYPVGLAAAALGRPPRPAGNYYADPVLFEGQPENRYFIYRHPLEQTRPYFADTFSRIEEIAGRVRAQGAAFVLVVFPRYQHWSTRECPDNWERGAYSDDDPYRFEFFRFFDQAAASASHPVLDLLPAFQATPEYPLVFRNDPHWNARGHDFVARQLEQYLAAQRLLP